MGGSTMTHLGDRVVDLAFGNVAPAERTALEEHLAGCEACRGELARTERAVAGLALDLPASRPPLSVRERLGAAVRGAQRFWPFIDRLADLFDLGGEQAEHLLARIDEPQAWVPDSVVDGGLLLLVSPGPRRDGAIASLFRLQPGARYPRHRHGGDERLLMLQGGVRFDDGSCADAGDAVESVPGTAHSFEVLPGAECIAAVLLTGPIELDVDRSRE